MADAYVPAGPLQTAVAYKQLSPDPLPVPIPLTTAGHALVAAAVIGTYGVRIDSITDDGGNGWTRALDGVDAMGARVEIWYVLGANAITQATVSVIRGVAIVLMEWDGLPLP